MAGEVWALKTAAGLLEKSPEAITAGEKLVAAIMPESVSTAAREIALKAADVARKIGIVQEDARFPLVKSLHESASLTGSHIVFKPNGVAQFSDGTTTAYRRLDDLFFTYESEGTPEEISRTFNRGYLHNEGSSAFQDVQRDKPMMAVYGAGENRYAWSDLRPKERDAARAFIPDQSIPIGLGGRRQAWFTPSEDVVVLGPIQERLNVPMLLQPTRREIVGSRMAEWFPIGESDSVTRADVHAVNHQFKMHGYSVDDSFTANYVRLQNGKVVRVDPEDIYPMSDRARREYVAAHPDG